MIQLPILGFLKFSLDLDWFHLLSLENYVYLSMQELLGLVTDARVGGMLSGKAGVVHFHTGSADSLLQPLWDVVNASKGAIPLAHMIPTHVSGRGPALLKVSFFWMVPGSSFLSRPSS